MARHDTMSQIGHKSAKLTLEVYTDVDNRRHGANERLGRLLRAPEWAQIGTNLADSPTNGSHQATTDEAKTPETAGNSGEWAVPGSNQ